MRAQREFKFLIFGMCLGGVLVYDYLSNIQKQLNDRFVDECNLRTDLLNWITTEGIYLEEDEFFPQYTERARFINIVTHEEE